jgi:hypothetical protein
VLSRLGDRPVSLPQISALVTPASANARDYPGAVHHRERQVSPWREGLRHSIGLKGAAPSVTSATIERKNHARLLTPLLVGGLSIAVGAAASDANRRNATASK